MHRLMTVSNRSLNGVTGNRVAKYNEERCFRPLSENICWQDLAQTFVKVATLP